MLEKNKIYLMDCMEGLKMLDDNSVDLFLFSPPYNKKGYLGKKGSHNAKEGLWNEVIKYDNYDDDMPEDEYEKWQIESLPSETETYWFYLLSAQDASQEWQG